MKPIKIVQGSSKTFQLALFDEETLQPLDLTNCSEIIVGFPGANGIPVEVKLTQARVAFVGGQGGGVIQVSPLAADTALMNAVGMTQLQDLQIQLTISGAPLIVILESSLNILPQSYSLS